MITSSIFAGKKYAILGLARSGLAAAEALLASGAEVAAWDRQDVAREKLAGRATLADPMELDLSGFDALVVSPGVPLNTHPIRQKAADAGVPIIGDIELFAMARAELPPHKVVGITGTNGKSTTTALVHHLLEQAGMPARMGGNIGLPILEQDPLPAGGVYVLELSSYQIDLTQSLDCDVAALTNITPDHLDRYDGFEGYKASKQHLFEMQSAQNLAIVGEQIWREHMPIYEHWQAIKSDRLWCMPNCHSENPFDRSDWPEIELTSQAKWPSLQGPHNWENALIAIMICQELGLSDEVIAQGLESFRGLAHRMEWLGEFGGVTVYNDSKATNAASSAPALAAFPPENDRARIHWIVGGLAKADGLGECAEHLGNVACAYTIGEAGPMFAKAIEGTAPVRESELLCEAARQALKAAKPGDVVLLSPACASFDQFRDFEARGDDFRRIIGALTGNPSDPSNTHCCTGKEAA